MWRHFNVSSNHSVARQETATNIDFRHEVFIFHKPNWCSLIDNYFRHKTPCGIRKLTAAFVSKIGVFSRFSWSLDFGAKMAKWRNFHFRFSKFSDTENESLFESSWWIFMCQNVNIIVYIWSLNLAICAIAKIGGCTRLITVFIYGWQSLATNV